MRDPLPHLAGVGHCLGGSCAADKVRPKNNFAVFLPLALPSPTRGEGFEDGDCFSVATEKERGGSGHEH